MLLGHPAFDQDENVEKNANLVWNPATLAWEKETQPAGGGGAVTIADGADVAEGATTDAAIVTDTTGTVSGKLRGLVKWAFERMPAALGQTTKSGSLPVTLASDQGTLATTFTPVAQGTPGASPWPVTFTQAQVTFTPISGTVTANAGTNLNTSLLMLDTTFTGRINTQGQKTMAGSTPVVLPSDQSTIPVTFTALPAGTNVIGTMTANQGAAPWSQNLTQLAGTSLTANEGASGSGTQRVTLATHSSVENNPIGAVTLANSVNKALITLTGSLVTNTTVANQVIKTYTVTTGKTLYVNYVLITATLSPSFSASFNMGVGALQASGNTLFFDQMAYYPHQKDTIFMDYSEPMFFTSTTVVRIVCSPFTNRTTAWFANFGGFEK